MAQEIAKSRIQWQWIILPPLCVYVVIEKPWKLWLAFTAGYLAFALVVVLLAPKLFGAPKNWSTRKTRKIQLDVFLWAVSRGLLCGSLYVVGVDIASWIIQSATAATPHAGWGFVLVAATILLGAIFFIFRLKCRALYGITEIVAGIGLAVYKVSGSKASGLDPELLTALLTASAYLIVRGADNVHQGFVAAASKDHLAHRILYFIIGEPETEALKPRKNEPAIPPARATPTPKEPAPNVTVLDLSFTGKQIREGTVRIINSGDGEAHHVKWMHSQFYGPPGILPPFISEGGLHCHSEKLFPKGVLSMGFNVASGQLGLVAGVKVLYAHGRIEYEDSRGVKYDNRYHFRFDPEEHRFLPVLLRGNDGAKLPHGHP